MPDSLPALGTAALRVQVVLPEGRGLAARAAWRTEEAAARWGRGALDFDADVVRVGTVSGPWSSAFVLLVPQGSDHHLARRF